MDKIDEILERRTDTVYPSKKILAKILKSGKKIRLYQGFDPTGTRLHLGHTVGIRKLMEFANLGHDVIFLFGDGTVLVGDPSERNTGRTLITEEEVVNNAKNWKKQIAPLVDFKKIRILHNKDWLTKLTLKDIIKIGSKISAIQLFKRDNFTERLKKGDTVYYHETMYPLLQGYDSVHMDVDLEIGGTDQMFNMLIGRELQKKFNNKEKLVLTTKMIVGTDGKKMSKTSNNCIWLDETPKNMYGKLMATKDELIPKYFEFFTNLSMDEINKIKTGLKKKQLDPLTYKKKLALTITAEIHGKDKAKQAQDEFEKVVQNKQTPSQIPTFQIKNLKQNPINILDLLTETKLAASRSEAKRLIKQKAVEINEKKMLEIKNIRLANNTFIKAGKRKWLRLIA